MEKPEINILWVEDNLGDILLIQEAFEKVQLNYRLHVVSDGIEAMDFLQKKGRFARAAKPDLIILDLRLPRKTGSEVIRDMKADPELAEIPLVVLSGIPDRKNILGGVDPKRCLYLNKPASLAELEELAQKIHNFWLALTA